MAHSLGGNVASCNVIIAVINVDLCTLSFILGDFGCQIWIGLGFLPYKYHIPISQNEKELFPYARSDFPLFGAVS